MKVRPLDRPQFVFLEDEKSGVYQITVAPEPSFPWERRDVQRSRHKPIEGHYLIEVYHTQGGGHGGWDSYSELVGVAHSKKELPRRIYECALREAKKVAKRVKNPFRNLTKRGKKSKLEKAASSSS